MFVTRNSELDGGCQVLNTSTLKVLLPHILPRDVPDSNISWLDLGTDKKLRYCWETMRRESMPRIAEMDVEKQPRLNHLQMYFKVIKSGTNRKLVYDFLLVVYSKFCRITHRF